MRCAQLASEGLITGIPSIPVPATVPIPFRDYIGSVRFDWAQSSKSQWFLRTSQDSYLTHNALVQQATLPSTGLITHNNYWNAVISNTYSFSPTWLGNLVLDASLLHLTQTRNSDLGFAMHFPSASTALTISGFETFGDNQFATPITLFPDLRNQDKYQFRYDLSHVAGSHALKFGVDFIHEPVLGGAFASTAEQFITYPSNPDLLRRQSVQFYFVPPTAQCNPEPDPVLNPGITCAYTPAGDGSFSQNVQRLGLYAEDSWRVSHHLTVNYGLRYQTTWGLLIGSGRSQADNAAYHNAAGAADSDRAQRAARLPQTDCAASRDRLLTRQQRENRNSRRLWHVLRRSRTERMGDGFSRCEQHKCHRGHLHLQRYVPWHICI